jgi:hypothetical protein
VIVEILFGLAILAVFTAAAGKLFHFNFRVLHQTTVQADNTTRFDLAIAQMRRDMSAARMTETVDAQTLVIHTSDGDIHWRADGQNLARASGGVERQWQVGQPITFAKDGQIVLVQTSPDPASALALAGEGGAR